MASVRSAVSRSSMPRQQIAMASALIWQSGISPAVNPATKSRISADSSARPSLFLSITSFATMAFWRCVVVQTASRAQRA